MNEFIEFFSHERMAWILVLSNLCADSLKIHILLYIGLEFCADINMILFLFLIRFRTNRKRCGLCTINLIGSIAHNLQQFYI